MAKIHKDINGNKIEDLGAYLKEVAMQANIDSQDMKACNICKTMKNPSRSLHVAGHLEPDPNYQQRKQKELYLYYSTLKKRGR